MIINYTDSGVKTLRAASTAFLIFSIFMAFILGIYSLKEEELLMAGIAIMIVFSGFFTYAFGKAIATIAENALYIKQKAELEEEKD